MRTAIPAHQTDDESLNRVLEAIKLNLDGITGQTSNSDKLVALSKEATPLQLVNLVNLLAKRIGLDGVTAIQELTGFLPSYLASPLSGFRSKIINGGIAIDQRNAGAAQTFTAAAALAYCVDRWYGYCTGANVTGQRVAGTAPNQYNYRFTGAASVTKIGFAQRIEAANSQDLAGTTATFSVDLANSLLTTVTWTAWRANTNDTFGTLAIPTRTQIGSGAFTVSSTLARYSAQISVPTAATTGIEIEVSVGAQTSGTWTIGNLQFEAGSVAKPFEVRPIGYELALCQRYYETGYEPQTYLGGGIASSTAYDCIKFAVTKRAAPTVVTNTWQYYSGGTGTNFTPTGISANVENFSFQATGLTNWNGWNGTSSYTWSASAEL